MKASRQPISRSRPMPGIDPRLLAGLYAFLGLLPLGLAAAQGLPVRDPWRELSSGLVMVGFALLLVQFLLSGRFRQISGRVGIDATIRFHRLAAWMVLAFILVHPFLYAVPRLAEGPAAAWAALERMFTSRGLRSGVIAWGLLIVLVAMAAWRDRLPVGYEAWRLSHGLGAALVAGLGAHHTLRVGTYAADPVMAGLWLALTAAALLSLAHVYVLKPLIRMSRPYRIVANRPVADGMWEVAVEPRTGRRFDFAAGQFAWVNFGHSAFSLTEHPFSISSAPGDLPRLAFTIKESGDFTNRIGSLASGTVAYLDGPHGSFVLAGREPAPLVFIAGGVGFAPVMSMLRDLSQTGWAFPVTLVYGNRAEAQILYRDEIEAIAGRLDLTVHLVLSDPPAGWTGPRGELTRDILAGCLGRPDPGALFFVCGPPAMMDSVEASLSGLGVPAGNIVAERFSYG